MYPADTMKLTVRLYAQTFKVCVFGQLSSSIQQSFSATFWRECPYTRADLFEVGDRLVDGISYENFEMNEEYYQGQTFWFGFSYTVAT